MDIKEIIGINKNKKMLGIAMTVIGLVAFGVSHNQGLIGQENYSSIGCVLDARPTQCAAANNGIIVCN